MANERILVVDDDISQRRLIEFWLKEEGYSVVTASDGNTALRTFTETSPALVISDIRMPGLSGLDLLGRIKALNPDTPVILITAFGAVGDAVEAMKLGAADYVLKPLNPDELKVNVQRALEHQQLLNETPIYGISATRHSGLKPGRGLETDAGCLQPGGAGCPARLDRSRDGRIRDR